MIIGFVGVWWFLILRDTFEIGVDKPAKNYKELIKRDAFTGYIEWKNNDKQRK